MARRSKSWFISRLVRSTSTNDVIVINNNVNITSGSGTDDSDVAAIAQLRREADSDASVISNLSSTVSTIASFADSDLQVVAKLRNDVDSDSIKLQALEITVAGLPTTSFDSDQIVAIINENSTSGSVDSDVAAIAQLRRDVDSDSIKLQALEQTVAGMSAGAGFDSDQVVTIINENKIIDNKTYSYSGALQTNTSTKRLYVSRTCTLTTVDAYVATAPSGANITLNIKKNGSSLSTITISDGNSSSLGNSFNTAFVKGDFITVDITQVGSSTAGTDLYTNFNFV